MAPARFFRAGAGTPFSFLLSAFCFLLSAFDFCFLLSDFCFPPISLEPSEIEILKKRGRD
jgi:hypothetical protein